MCRSGYWGIMLVLVFVIRKMGYVLFFSWYVRVCGWVVDVLVIFFFLVYNVDKVLEVMIVFYDCWSC